MLHDGLAHFEKLDRGNVLTFLLGIVVAGMSVAIVVMLYMPLR